MYFYLMPEFEGAPCDKCSVGLKDTAVQSLLECRLRRNSITLHRDSVDWRDSRGNCLKELGEEKGKTWTARRRDKETREMRILQLALQSPSPTAGASNAPLLWGARTRAQVLQSSGFWTLCSRALYSSVSSSFGGFTFALQSPSAAGVTSASKLLRAKENRHLVCMASAAPVEVLVKAATGHPDQLGDCPFSQRVLLTLEEKGIPYDAKLIDTSNKPAWFLEANPEGKVPVIRDDGKWVADSDVITVLLEEKFPDPPLAAPAITPGSKIFGAFLKFLKSKNRSDESEQGLVDEFKLLDEHLKENGPFLNGQKISSLDLSLAPKLYHITIASKHYKNWSIPAEFTSLNSYIEAIFARESFIKTKVPEEVVVEGWRAKATGA